MSTLLMFVPLALTVVLLAVLVKLASRLYRSARVSWPHAFGFSALSMGVGVLGTVLNVVSGVALGPLISGVLGLGLNMAVGGWFLGPRALSATGEPVGFKGGAALAALALGIVFVLGVVAAVLVPLLSRGG